MKHMSVFTLLAHLSAGCDGFHGPAVQRDELHGGSQDSSLKLLLRLVVLVLVSALILVTSHRYTAA